MKFRRKIMPAFLIVFLLSFMLFIFGPAEIFFANESEFQFVYGEFAGYLAVGSIILAVVAAALLALLPEKIYQVILAVIFGISFAGYVQVMFLNKNLDLLGVNPEGYKPVLTQAIISLFCWCVVILVAVIFARWKKDIWKKCFCGLSGFLLCIQMVALVSLWVTAKDTAWKYEGGVNGIYPVRSSIRCLLKKT